MTNYQGEVPTLPAEDQALCNCRDGRCVYVHLHSGEVRIVPGARALEVGDDDVVVLGRAMSRLAVIPRRDVYICSFCEHSGSQPT
jgi:hypothetical protein